jgi:hypothetical protein
MPGSSQNQCHHRKNKNDQAENHQKQKKTKKNFNSAGKKNSPATKKKARKQTQWGLVCTRE